MIKGDSLRNACRVVNNLTPNSPHKLSKSTLGVLFQSLPPSIKFDCLLSNTTDVAIMDFIQKEQSQQRQQHAETLSLLTTAEEALLVQWIEQRTDMNFSVEREEIIAHARLIIERERGFEIDSSMRGWYEGFMHRHPYLGPRLGSHVKRVRLTAQACEENIAMYFTRLKRFMHLPPEQIYAADETGLDGDGSRRAKVIVPKGTKRPAQQLDSYREHTSILHIGNAAGDSLPMAVMFKGKDKLEVDLMAQLREGAIAGVQENGYFKGCHFMPVLEHFNRHGVAARPLLLIIDGAKGHLDEAASVYAKSKQIDILCLPSNLTHLLQVADVALFGPFKHAWKLGCSALKYERTRRNEERGIKRMDIIPLVKKAWEKAMTRENIQAGFRATGIYPFDPNAYKSQLKSNSRSDLPLLLTPAAQMVESSTTLASISQSLPLPNLSPSKPAACSLCGQTPRKRVVKRTLSTKSGLLLTGEEAQTQFRLITEEKEAEEKEKERKATDRVEKKRKREEETERLRLVREERAAKKAAAGPAQKQRKRKGDTAVSTEAKQTAEHGELLTAESDKENREPNTERPAESPVILSSPLPLPPLIASPSPSPPPVPLVVPVVHEHGTRRAQRMRTAAMR
jgi:hypothetical protein